MLTYFYAFVALAIVLVGHILGIHGLYLAWAPYDVFMHIAGGIGIAFFLAAIILVHFPALRNKRMIIVAGVFIFGIVWELFEVYYNIAGYTLWTKLYYLDTAKDLIDDVVGGALIALLYRI